MAVQREGLHWVAVVIPKPTKPEKATRRRIMPRCKHCAHPHSKHKAYGCLRCSACPYYAPAIGIRQKRATPEGALRRRCNALWAKIVKAGDGGCVCPRETHNGSFQAAHGFGKKAYPAVRYLPINGWKLASGCHRYYTGHSIEWDQFMRDQLGDAYGELRRLALENAKPDLPGILARLESEAKARGIQ